MSESQSNPDATKTMAQEQNGQYDDHPAQNGAEISFAERLGTLINEFSNLCEEKEIAFAILCKPTANGQLVKAYNGHIFDVATMLSKAAKELKGIIYKELDTEPV